MWVALWHRAAGLVCELPFLRVKAFCCKGETGHEFQSKNRTLLSHGGAVFGWGCIRRERL